MPSRLAVPCWALPSLLRAHLVRYYSTLTFSLLTIAFAGTIRGDFALSTGRNICHGSDTVEHAQEEIESCAYSFFIYRQLLTFFSFSRWFPEGVTEYVSYCYYQSPPLH